MSQKHGTRYSKHNGMTSFEVAVAIALVLVVFGGIALTILILSCNGSPATLRELILCGLG